MKVHTIIAKGAADPDIVTIRLDIYTLNFRRQACYIYLLLRLVYTHSLIRIGTTNKMWGILRLVTE